jgi:membrane protein
VKFPLLSFCRRVLSSFRRNQGLLLAGAVAYYALLSLVPLFILLLVALSQLIDRQRLIDAVSANLEFLVPGQTGTVTAQVESFLENRHVIGVVGVGALLFFSAMAFSVLENAVAMIFHHRMRLTGKIRHILVSAVIPYLFVMALGAGLLLVTVIGGALEAVGRRSIHVMGHVWSLAGLSASLLRVLGVAGSTLLLTALYMVMPVGRVPFTRALLGALAATALWEGVRRLLVWYFAHLSLVNVVYGSVGTTVIFLLTLEAASVIFLLGAQVIAELEHDAEPAVTRATV